MPPPNEERAQRLQFSGFASPNTTPVPDELFDVLAPALTEGELRVLLYVIRRTFGFKKQHDRISLSQMVNGIRRRDGTTLDRGTGMGKPAVIRSVRSLIKLGILTVEKTESEHGDADVNVYALRFQEGVVSQENHPGIPREPPVVSQENHGVVLQKYPQETGNQQTVKQGGTRSTHHSNAGEKLTQGPMQQLTATSTARTNGHVDDKQFDLWQSVLADLAEQMVPANFTRWLARTSLLHHDAGAAVVGVPDQVSAEQLAKRFDPLVRRALADACGEPVTVQYQVIEG